MIKTGDGRLYSPLRPSSIQGKQKEQDETKTHQKKRNEKRKTQP